MGIGAAVLLGLLWVTVGQSNSYWQSHVYIVDLALSNPGAYRLLIPISVDITGSPSPAMGNLMIIDGSATFGIIVTQLGPALNISGSESVALEWGHKVQVQGRPPPLNLSYRHPNGDVDFSMWTGTDPDTRDYNLGAIWIYIENQNPGQWLNVTLLLRIQDVRHIATVSTTQNGWQSLTVSSYARVP